MALSYKYLFMLLLCTGSFACTTSKRAVYFNDQKSAIIESSNNVDP